MANPQIENEVTNHMEFFGYKIEPLDAPEGTSTKMLRAEHPVWGAINISLFETTVVFSIWFSLNDFAAANRQSLLEAVNDLNSQHLTSYNVGTWSEGSAALFCRLAYRGLYEKTAFGQFVSIWQGEMQAFRRTEIDKFFSWSVP